MNDTPPPHGLRDLLDSSFGDGPAHRPVDQVLARGRRRLVRRRLTSGAAAVAVVGALATTFALATGGSSPSAGIDPAGSMSPGPADCGYVTYQGAVDPDWSMEWGDSSVATAGVPGERSSRAPGPTGPTGTPAEGSGSSASSVTTSEPIPAECADLVPEVLVSEGESAGRTGSITATDGRGAIGAPVEIDADGMVHHEDDVTVLRSVSDPLGWEAPDRSAAVEYRYDGRTAWALVTFVDLGRDCGSWTASAAEPEAGTTLEEWAAEHGSRIERSGACEDAGPTEPEPSREATQQPTTSQPAQDPTP